MTNATMVRSDRKHGTQRAGPPSGGDPRPPADRASGPTAAADVIGTFETPTYRAVLCCGFDADEEECGTPAVSREEGAS